MKLETDQWVRIARTILVAVLAIASILGYDLAIIQPREIVVQEETVKMAQQQGMLSGGVSHFTELEADTVKAAAPTAIGTATPALMADSLGVSNLFEVRDAATPVAAVADGGAWDINGSMDIDGTTFDVNVSGSAVILSSEAAADAIHLDANAAVTTGLDIDLGSVSGMTIDGGLVDIGGGTCGVADGDNDVCIKGVLEVDGETELDGALDADSTANIAGALTLQALFYPSSADETITDGETLTPTVTIYNLDSAGAVTMTLAASGTEGQLLILVGDDANDITINDTNVRTNDGNAQVLNQYDVLMWVYIDSEWIEIADTANS
jgi:hypothetical protein